MARLVAATFDEEADAESVAARLRRELGWKQQEVRISSLGRAGDPGGHGAVLAGRFEDDVLEAVTAAVEAAGGTLLVVRDWDE